MKSLSIRNVCEKIHAAINTEFLGGDRLRWLARAVDNAEVPSSG